MTGIDEAVTVHADDPAPPSVEPPGEPASSAAARPTKWDRPPPPHDWRFWVGGLGKILVAIGLLLLAFVAYQLWGTGIETARAQRALEGDFDELLAEAPEVGPAVVVDASADPAVQLADADTPAEPGDTAEPGATVEVLPVASQNIPEVESGDAVARIEIPAIGVDDIVVAGVSTDDLKKGPGHFPDTPLPGQLGNAAIAGHRTTYGSPFRNVDELTPGDEIRVTTLTGTYVYRVTGQEIVPPSAYEVVATTDPTRATLTLTSCHPEWTARDRIVITSQLDPAASSTVGVAVVNYGQPGVAAGEPSADEPASEDGVLPGPSVAAPGTAAVNVAIADAFAEGWFSDSAAIPHVAFWGLLLALIGLGAWLLSRRVRHDSIGLLVGIVPFVVALYFFFQNVNRLLPPNL